MHGAGSLPERVLSRFFKIRRVREKFCALLGIPVVYSYKTYVKNFLAGKTSDCGDYPHIISNWDNTPRCGKDGTVFIGSNPKLFKKILEKTVKDLLSRDIEHRIIFIKSWNEWAEGNYIEPDARFGRDWLEAIKEEVFV